MTREIHQEATFNAAPAQVYDALMDSVQHSAFTAAPATISSEVGGPFSVHGGYITGINVQLLPGQRIVQVWRTASWDDGDYSLVKFEIQPEGSGSKLVFEHIGFPEDAKDSLADGWVKRYWEPLQKYFDSPH